MIHGWHARAGRRQQRLELGHLMPSLAALLGRRPRLRAQAWYTILEEQICAADWVRRLELRVERMIHAQVGLQLVQLIDVFLARQFLVKRRHCLIQVMLTRVKYLVIVL